MPPKRTNKIARERPDEPAAPGTKASRAEKLKGEATAQNAEVPVDPASGVVYHLACAAKDIADRFIFVGDPGRVPLVAERFDKNSITFTGVHREIAVTTGTYKGTPVTVLSTGMGTDNCEIVINEIHALKEYNVKANKWATAQPKIRIIRVGTCGTPNKEVELASLIVSRHAIGMDNTCRYYTAQKGAHPASVAALQKLANETDLGKVGVYASMAAPAVTEAIVASYNGNAAVKKRRHIAVGITASASGFYGCQGRVVGRFHGRLAIDDLVGELGKIELPVDRNAKRLVTGSGGERVVNIEMENSAICFLSRILGYEAGTVCCAVAKRVGDHKVFASKEEITVGIADAITVALDALIS